MFQAQKLITDTHVAARRFTDLLVPVAGVVAVSHFQRTTRRQSQCNCRGNSCRRTGAVFRLANGGAFARAT
jgi:hypothetical protein